MASGYLVFEQLDELRHPHQASEVLGVQTIELPRFGYPGLAQGVRTIQKVVSQQKPPGRQKGA
jgi:hypothetical protein